MVTGGVPSSSGFPDLATARFNPDGGLDTSFGKGGIVVTSNVGPLSAIALQSDGKIVVGGTGATVAVAVRYNSDGSLDSTFGSGGIATIRCNPTFCGFAVAASGIAVQPDGKIVVAGVKLFRFSADGQPDPSFGAQGVAPLTGDAPTALALLPNGKILVTSGSAGSTICSFTSNCGFVTRYNSTGSLDTSVAINGQLASAGGSSSVLLANGQILVAGTLSSNLSSGANGFAVTRYQSAGFMDSSFGTHGGVLTAIPGFPKVVPSGLGVESNGDIVASGTASAASQVFALARYTANGKLDPTFGTKGIVTTSFVGNVINASALVIQSDDKIVVAGSQAINNNQGNDTQWVLTRYLAH